jgi:hypothetical protein
MGEVQRIIDHDPERNNPSESRPIVVGRMKTFDEVWDENRSLSWT